MRLLLLLLFIAIYLFKYNSPTQYCLGNTRANKQ